MTANDSSVLDGSFESEDITLALSLTSEASHSKFFTAMPEDLKDILTKQKVTYNNHGDGIEPEHFKKNSKLVNFYDVLSTNKDKSGRPFVSTIEAKKYPFFATQWHPEKILLFVNVLIAIRSCSFLQIVSFFFCVCWIMFSEWKVGTNVDHSKDSVEANSWPARFFVNECRKSLSKPQHLLDLVPSLFSFLLFSTDDNHFADSTSEKEALIYNYEPTYTGDTGSFMQCYLFSH